MNNFENVVKLIFWTFIFYMDEK